MMTVADTTAAFWLALETAVNPANYKPLRNPNVMISCLEADGELYYVLKQPIYKNYLRLDAGDYALWWQMDGNKTLKDLLFYSLMRFRSLPIGRLNSLVDDLRAGHFLLDQPTDMYAQVKAELAHRSPDKRGERLLQGLLETKWEIAGLDGFFSQLYRLSRWLYTPLMQGLLLLFVIVGGIFFAREVWQQNYFLFDVGGWSFLTLLALNLLVIGIHELAHGVTVKHFARELNRGGCLIYWGLPAFFVDTRDIWLSPLRVRLWVVWAGPYSGLIIGGLVGVLLTAVSLSTTVVSTTVATLLYQFGFLAYVSVLLNLNPLLELDGYFMLMDWLDLPNLRRRAFQFWRVDLRNQLHVTKSPARIWANCTREARLFLIYGGFAFVYSLVAAALAFYFWRSRLGPWMLLLWQMGGWGHGLLLLVTAVLFIPAAYFLAQMCVARLQAGYDWLAKHNYLDKGWVPAALIGLPVASVITAVWFILDLLPAADVWQTLFIWILLLAAAWSFVAVARQVAGSRLQAVFWALLAVIAGLGWAWLTPAHLPGVSADLWYAFGWLLAAVGVLMAGCMAWWTVRLTVLKWTDYGLMGGFVGLGLLTMLGLSWLGYSSWETLFMLFLLTIGSLLMSPLLLNFGHTRFTLPWLCIMLSIWLLPWATAFTGLHLLTISLWLFAGILYWFMGRLAWFARHEVAQTAVSIFDERKLLISSYQHFIEALYAAYEPEFGRRPLVKLKHELAAQTTLDPTIPLWTTSQQIQQRLIVVNDRLDDIAGSAFTQRAGQAAYDSLSWLEAETIGRHVLAASNWGAALAQGFIPNHDQYGRLIREADIFAGFDHETTQALLAMMRQQTFRRNEILARQGVEAERFYMVVSGTVDVLQAGEKIGMVNKGGYFGSNALLDTGTYNATYRVAELATVLWFNRSQFDPLWRADTTLASQIQIKAVEWNLLQKITLFAGLSSQQLTAVAARLQRRQYAEGVIIVEKGMPRSHFFIVAAGEVEVVVEGEHGNGRKGSGEHFGEYALFADTPYTATYRALTDVELLLLDEPTFDRLAVECDQLAHYITQIGSGHILASRQQIGPTGLWA